MSTQLIKKIRDLRTAIQSRTLKTGQIIVQNMSHRFLFAFDFSKEDDGVVMTFYGSKEEFSTLYTVSHYPMDEIRSYEDFIDLKGLRKGIQVSFVPFSELPETQQAEFGENEDREKVFMSLFPQVLSFNHPENIEADLNKKEKEFLESCLDKLLGKDNIDRVLTACQSYEEERLVVILHYNRIGGMMTFEDEVVMRQGMDAVSGLERYRLQKPDELEIPELTAFRYVKRMESYFPETIEIQLSVSPTQYYEEFDEGSPKYVLKLACRGALIGMRLIEKLDVRSIQETVMQFLAQEGFHPKGFMTRGVYATRLWNILSPVMALIHVPLKIVESLPTLDGMNYEILMKDLVAKMEQARENDHKDV